MTDQYLCFSSFHIEPSTVRKSLVSTYNEIVFTRLLGSWSFLEFYHRRYAPELEVRIEATTDLKTWLPVWSSSEGPDAPAILSVSEEGQFQRLVVSAPDALPGQRVLLLRSSVTLTLP